MSQGLKPKPLRNGMWAFEGKGQEATEIMGDNGAANDRQRRNIKMCELCNSHDHLTEECGKSAVDSLVMPSPSGVVALFISKDGRVLANASDFNSSGYGGFSLRQAQEIRVKHSLAHEVMEKLSSPLICEAIDTYDAQKIMDSMCSRCGCRVEMVAVGHGGNG